MLASRPSGHSVSNQIGRRAPSPILHHTYVSMLRTHLHHVIHNEQIWQLFRALLFVYHDRVRHRQFNEEHLTSAVVGINGRLWEKTMVHTPGHNHTLSREGFQVGRHFSQDSRPLKCPSHSQLVGWTPELSPKGCMLHMISGPTGYICDQFPFLATAH